MANIKSAKKRILVIDRRTAENKLLKASVNTNTKKFRKLVSESKFDQAEILLKDLSANIQSCESKGVFHANNASRKISRLSKLLYQAKHGKKVVIQPVTPKAVVEEVVAPVEPVAVEPTAPVEKAVKPAKPAKAEPVAEEKPVKKAPAKKAVAPVADEKPAKKPAAKKAAASAEEKPVKKTTRAKKAE